MPARRFAVTVAGRDLGVTEVGAADDPAILLLHGVASSRTFLAEAFAAPLVAAGWRLLAADVRGHGESPTVAEVADHAFERIVDDVVALVHALGPRVVGGVSLGAHASVGAVARDRGGPDPVEAVLACLPGWTGTAVRGEGFHAAVAAAIRAAGVEGMITQMRGDQALAPWLRGTLVRDWEASDPASVAAALEALDGGRAPTAGDLASFPLPLAVVGWPDDLGHPIEVAREWADLAPTAALEEITIAALQDDRGVMGRAALRALRRVGVCP